MVESVSHDKLESQFSFLGSRDFSDRIEARCEVFIPIVFRTISFHVIQHSLAKVVFEESLKGLMLLDNIFEDHVPAIEAPIFSSETGDFVIVLLNIRIILCVNVNTLTSGLIAILYLSK